MAELLLATDLKAEQRHFTQMLFRSGEALLTVINSILDFSKIEAGKLELECIDFDLGEIVSEQIELFTENAARKGLEISSRMDADVPLLLRGDPVRLRQILSNLLNNAVKFTNHGTIALGIALVERSDTALLRFEVRDTGIGMEASALPRIFDAFSQADTSMTRTFGGTGLGLAISRQLCEMMGGEIHVESRQGEGSTFWFTVRFTLQSDDSLQPATALRADYHQTMSYIPRSRDSAGDEAGAERENSFSKCRILLAEDNLVNQEVGRSMLETFGCSVDIAQNGVEALQLLDSRNYDLVFMDCQMPRMDGYEATREIRKKEQAGSAHIPIIAMTAHAMTGDREVCLAAGMDDYVSKPFSMLQLSRKLDQWFAGRPLFHFKGEEHHQDSSISTGEQGASGDGGCIDYGVLGELEKLACWRSTNKLSQLIRIYLKNAPAQISGLRSDFQTGNMEALTAAAHTLVASSATLGALRLSDLCREAEQLARDNNIEKLGAVVSRIEAEYEAVQKCLEKRIKAD